MSALARALCSRFSFKSKAGKDLVRDLRSGQSRVVSSLVCFSVSQTLVSLITHFFNLLSLITKKKRKEGNVFKNKRRKKR